MKYSLASLFCHTRQPFSLLFHYPTVPLKITRRSIGELLFVAGIIAFNIGLFIKARNDTIDQNFRDDLRVWIRPLGRAQMFNLIVMFIMITRSSLLEFVFGMPFERGIAYHRWISRWFVFLFIIHGVLSWIRFQYSSITFAPVSWGFYAGCIMFILFAFTFRPIRRTSWELFYYSHQLLAVVGAVFAAYHGTLTYPAESGFSYTWRVDSYILYFFVALYVVDRIIRFMFGWLFCTEVISAKPEQIEVTRIEMKKSCFKLPYEEGQYVFVLIPSVSMFQWHPFSISSAPHEQNLTLHIKDSGGFTHKLRELAGKGEIRRILVDGPYGSLSVNLNQYQVVVLVAGGIGVTPMISILKHLVHKGLDNFTKVYFIWSVRDPLAFEWFADALNAAKSNPKVELKLFATRAKGASEGGITFTPSRPKMAEIFQEIKSANASCSATAVLACGPAIVVSEVSELCAQLSTWQNQFHFHRETFAF